MENFAIIALVEQMKRLMDEIVIRRVIQHSPDGFLFQTRSLKLPAFKISLSNQKPALYPSEARPPAEAANADFLMVLRKHLTSAEMVGMRKPLSERIVEMEFKTAVPSKELEVMSMVIELLPSAPNLILLDRERRVLTSFLPLTAQHGIEEYDPYQPPKMTAQIDLDRIAEGHTGWFDGQAFEQDPKGWLIRSIAGVGPVLADEILHRSRQLSQPVPETIGSILHELRSPASTRTAWIYTDTPLAVLMDRNDLVRFQRAVVSPIELESLTRSHSSRQFASFLEAVRFYHDELESRLMIEHAKSPFIRNLRDSLKRLADREKKLDARRFHYEHADETRRVAQLLVSSGLKPDERYPAVNVTDYFEEKPLQREVVLDPSITLRENIESMFREAQKAARGKNVVARQIKEIQARRGSFEEQVRRLQGIKDWDMWLAIEKKLRSGGRKEEASPRERSAPTRRMRVLQIENREVLVGRTARENDELTFHFAAPDDFWLHVADYTGSHVIVRNPNRDGELPDAVLTRAAELAAYFSQARNSSRVEVHYTKKKHVAKPRKAKPGLVRLQEFKSVKVEPRNWMEEAR